MKNLIEKIRKDLVENADIKTRESSQRFFKEKITCYGLKTPVVKKIGNTHFKTLSDASKEEIFNYCEILWQSGFLEESFIACEWSYKIHKKYEPEDFAVFERWINQYVNNWASCDTLCNHTVGTFIEMYPGYLSRLKAFTGSPNRWVRRASAVSLIVPARKGKFLPDILEIADKLLLDKDDMVQKGYGWMLKAASQAHLHEVFQYVLAHKHNMPRTSLRYAIEKMPVDLMNRAMDRNQQEFEYGAGA